MGAGVNIRRAVSEDAPAMAEVIARVREVAYSLRPGTSEYQVLVTDQTSEPEIDKLRDLIETGEDQSFCEVAEVAPIGIVAVLAAMRRTHADEVVYMFVDPAYQRKGIGLQLLGDLDAWSGRGQYVWAINNNQQAIDFYRARGFQPLFEEPDRELPISYVVLQRSVSHTGGAA